MPVFRPRHLAFLKVSHRRGRQHRLQSPSCASCCEDVVTSPYSFAVAARVFCFVSPPPFELNHATHEQNRYAQISSVIYATVETMIHGGGELIALSVVILIMNLGFAWIFHLEFSYLAEFSSWSNAFYTLFSIAMGSVNVDRYFREVGFGRAFLQNAQVRRVVLFLCVMVLCMLSLLLWPS